MKKWLLCGLLFFSVLSAYAQVSLTASVDKQNLALDDELTLVVQIEGVRGNIVPPQLPSLPAFNVYSRAREQSTINGETSLVFRYTMLPRFVGTATIGPVKFSYGNQTYQTEPITVRVYHSGQQRTAAAASAQPTDSFQPPAPKATQQADKNLPPLEASLNNQAYAHAAEPFFLVAAVSDQTPYVNESIYLAIRFYYSRAFYDAPYQKPSVSNIFMDDLGSTEGTQRINGTLYRYQEQRYQLTGAAAGKATVGSAVVHYRVGSSPLAALDRLFGGAAISPEKTAESAPFSLYIRALPTQDKPASFYGAVGREFNISAQISPKNVEAGDAVNLTVTVTGDGNLKSTGELKFPSVEGFKVYPAASESGSATASNGKPLHYKSFKAVYVPSSSGIYEIPAIAWSYFDPQHAKYKTLTSRALTVSVSPSSKTDSGFNFAAAAPTGNGVQTLTSDIAYLKTAAAPAPGALAQLADFGWLNWVVLALFAVCSLFSLFGRKSLAKKKPFLTAKSRLKQADRSEVIADVLADYLLQRFSIATGSLQLQNITSALQKKGVRPATAESFTELWQRLDAARFAPAELGAQSTANLSAQALAIISLMEEETK